MSLPPDLPTDLPDDLQHLVAERAPQPGFDVVVDRSRARRRRRRRTTAAAGLLAACLVGGAVALTGSTSPDPAPPEPVGPPTGRVDDRLPADVRAVVAAPRSEVFGLASSGDGVAALWADCDGHPDGCRTALVAASGSEVTGVLLDGDARGLEPVPDGWLVEEDGGPVRIGVDGSRQPLVDTGPGTVRATHGDTAVLVGGTPRLLRGTKLLDVPVPPGTSQLWGAHVTFTGRLAVAVDVAGSGPEVAVSDDGGATWTTGTTTEAAGTTGRLLAGDGDRLVLVDLGDDRRTGEVPVLAVSTSRDGGATWQPARGLGWGQGHDQAWQRPRDLSGVAVAPDGTSYLSTATHHVVRIDLDGNALPVQLSAFDRSVFGVADGVCALTERGRRDQLACSDDGGTTWEPRAVPGLR